MPSPFPGMDPYIEASKRWGTFHTLMVASLCGHLNAQLPERFVASVEEYVWVLGEDSKTQYANREPDVYVSEEPGSTTTILLPEYEPKRHHYVEIVDKEFRSVVTAIEVLSPTNKAAGADRTAYLNKRKEYLAKGLSLVEYDLLRRGKRLPLSTPPPEMKDYYIMVCRYWDLPKADFWTFTMRDPFPLIPVPLVDDVPAIALDLKPCVDYVYDGARFATQLHYAEPLSPRPSKQDAAWLKELLAERRSQKPKTPEKE